MFFLLAHETQRSTTSDDQAIEGVVSFECRDVDADVLDCSCDHIFPSPEVPESDVDTTGHFVTINGDPACCSINSIHAVDCELCLQIAVSGVIRDLTSQEVALVTKIKEGIAGSGWKGLLKKDIVVR